VFRDTSGSEERSARFHTESPTPTASDAAYHDPAYFGRYDRRRRRRVAKSRAQVLDALEFARPGPLLDVGCSLGYTLEAARRLGLPASGTDVSAHAVDACRRRGFVALPGSLHELPYADASFTIVTMKHVLEHTPDPRAALAEVRRVLRPRGVVFVAVPNADYFKAVRSPDTSRFFRGEAGRDHFLYYTAATLSRLLGEEGFEVCSVHPCLLHRLASRRRLLAEALAFPLRLPLARLATWLGLRKEFWLVARKRRGG